MNLSSKLIFLCLCAAAIILLLVRYYRRVRRGKSASEPVSAHDTQPSAATDPSPSAVDEALAAVPPSLVSSEHAIDLVPSLTARSDLDVSWKDRKLFAKLHSSDQMDDANELPTVEPHDVPTVGIRDYVFGSITPLFASLLPETAQRLQKTKAQLLTAGYFQPHAAQNLAAIRYVSMMSMLILFGMLLIVVPARFEAWVMGSLVVFPLLGWAVPRIYVQARAAERTNAIERAMPDMLDMLNMCVSQGLTVPESLDRVGRDLQPVYPELAQELSIVSQQAEVGTLQVAMDNFSKRMDVSEVHSFTSLINQTSRLGTSISAALTEYSDSMRESLRQRADEKANQASFKLLFPTVFCLMPAVYIFLLGPAIIELSRFFNEGGRDTLNQRTQAVERVTR